MLAALSRALVVALGVAPAAAQAQQLEKVTFATNWVAEAEHGGFYQALVDGTYRKARPRRHHYAGRAERQPPAATARRPDRVLHERQHAAGVRRGRRRTFRPWSSRRCSRRTRRCCWRIPDQGIEKFEDLKKLTLFISKEGVASYFQWMKHDFGFREQQVKPYTFNPQPFLADKKTAMQGYVTSEPYAVEKAGQVQAEDLPARRPGLRQLLDADRDPPRPGREQARPGAALRQRLVIGWYNYLYGDNAAANARIKRDNPEMTDELIAYSIAKMKEYGIVDSGDSLKLGIGAMTDARMKSFFDKMVAAGVVKGSIDYKKAYTLRFVNKGVGVDLRPKN